MYVWDFYSVLDRSVLNSGVQNRGVPLCACMGLQVLYMYIAHDIHVHVYGIHVTHVHVCLHHLLCSVR